MRFYYTLLNLILQILFFLYTIYKQMKLTYILIYFGIIYSCSSVVILQSTTITTIVSPAGASTIYSTYYDKNRKNAAGTGVNWLTSSKVSSPTIYQSLFYANCIGKANLTITAATSFNAYLDGTFIGSGNNYSKIYKFPINIKCGNHNLTVIVYTTAKVNQGLTFSLNQDQSNCYKCQVNGYWNEYSCQCSCITTGCACTSPKVWRPYPFCGCGCPIVTSRFPLRLFCLYPRYRSEATCGCVCHYRYCPPGQYFNQDTCQCYTIIY